jgi:hypothetical protein
MRPADALGAQVLTEGVNAINRTSRYDGSLYGVTLEVAKFKTWLPFPKFDLEHCFEQAAKRDWPSALARRTNHRFKSAEGAGLHRHLPQLPLKFRLQLPVSSSDIRLLKKL